MATFPNFKDVNGPGENNQLEDDSWNAAIFFRLLGEKPIINIIDWKHKHEPHGFARHQPCHSTVHHKGEWSTI